MYLVLAFAFVTVSGSVFAQKPDSLNEKCMNILNLTKEQKLKMEEIHKSHKNEMQINKRLLNEKEAQLQELRTSNNSDINLINAKVDEISILKSKMMKEHEAINQEIRKILTDEQRAIYDKEMKGNKGRHKAEMEKNKPCPAQK